MLPPIIQKASEEIQKLPGVGRRGAGKMALDILNLNEEQFNHFQNSIVRMRKEVFFCPNCGFFADNSVNSNIQNKHNEKVFNIYLQEFLPFFAKDLCSICANPERNPYQICVVEKATDILNIEKSQIYHGFYHVLGKLISPLDQVFAEDTTLFGLFQRIDSLLNLENDLNDIEIDSKNVDSKTKKLGKLGKKSNQITEKTADKTETVESETVENAKESKVESKTENKFDKKLTQNQKEKTENINLTTNLNAKNSQITSQKSSKNSLQNIENGQNSKTNSKSKPQIELILFFKTGFSAEATTAYIREKIEQEELQNQVKLTKLAEGLPLYYNPDNLDQATMIKALEDRKNIF